jgi:hypothetical protein
MKHRSRSLVSVMLATGLLAALAVPASAQIFVGDRFNGTALRPAWKQTNSTWRVGNGVARVNVMSVDPNTNVGYAVINMKGTHKRGLRIQSQVRLSPGRSNVGIVGPYKDVENHLFCRVEVTPAHPLGMVVVGHRLRGGEPTVQKSKSALHLQPGAVYRLVTERHRALITCALWRKGTNVTTIRYKMKPAELSAFGGGKKAGLRVRLVSLGTRRDEDDGRSKFQDFRVSSI